MSTKFTELETASYYDAEDPIYRSFWDREGSLHWGLYDDFTGRDFLKACANLNEFMLEKASISPAANVIDIGCGNGNTAMWLSSRSGCRVTGIDLSGVRIDNANEVRLVQPREIQARVTFEKASAVDLPFQDETFTHSWSQASIYHVHDKEAALRESYRVLEPGGTFVFDDLTKPTPEISDAAKTYVYDRLLFDTDYSFDSYQHALKDAGFEVLEAVDLSQHLKTSYQCLGEIALRRDSNPGSIHHKLSIAYGQTVAAIERGEVGWAFYLCRK